MRYFKFNSHLTVPRTLRPGLGNTHVRPMPDDTIELDDVACAKESRFINGRIKAGDMTEIKQAEHTGEACAYQKHIAKHAANAEAIANAKTEATPAAPAAKGK